MSSLTGAARDSIALNEATEHAEDDSTGSGIIPEISGLLRGKQEIDWSGGNTYMKADAPDVSSDANTNLI